jgi:lipopolysaccharide transport system ATP-binding protein
LDNGLTLLFVSHTSGTVRSLCDHAIWLRDGEVAAYGTAEEVCGQYDKYCWSASGMDVQKIVPKKSQPTQPDTTQYDSIRQAAKVKFDEYAKIERHGNGALLIDNFYLENSDGVIVESVRYDEVVCAVYQVVVIKDIDYELEVGITIKDLQGTHVYSAIDFEHGTRLFCASGSRFEMRMHFKMPLRAGKYSISTGLFGFPVGHKYADGVIDFSKSVILDRLEYAYFFSVLPRKGHCLYGPVHADARLSVIMS